MNTLTALFEMIKTFFSWKQSDTENKSELDIVKTKRSLKKGTNYAEKIINITDKYTKYFTEKDLRKYNSLKKRFENNN